MVVHLGCRLYQMNGNFPIPHHPLCQYHCHRDCFHPRQRSPFNPPLRWAGGHHPILHKVCMNENKHRVTLHFDCSSRSRRTWCAHANGSNIWIIWIKTTNYIILLVNSWFNAQNRVWYVFSLLFYWFETSSFSKRDHSLLKNETPSFFGG